MTRTLPLPAGAPERLSRTISLIAHIPAVIITITYPCSIHTVAVITAEKRRRTRSGRTSMMFIWAICTIKMAITFPVIRNTIAIWLTLEFILVAHPWWSCSWNIDIQQFRSCFNFRLRSKTTMISSSLNIVITSYNAIKNCVAFRSGYRITVSQPIYMTFQNVTNLAPTL